MKTSPIIFLDPSFNDSFFLLNRTALIINRQKSRVRKSEESEACYGESSSHIKNLLESFVVCAKIGSRLMTNEGQSGRSRSGAMRMPRSVCLYRIHRKRYLAFSENTQKLFSSPRSPELLIEHERIN